VLSALLLLGGVAALAYAVKRTAPDAVELVLVGALSGAATLWFVTARRAAAVAAGAVTAPHGLLAELLRGGVPLPQSPYHGLERVPALALWTLGCAAFLCGGDADEERGPAVLGLVPPLLFVAVLVFGPATTHGRRTAVVTLGLVALVLAVVLGWRVVSRRLRSARRPS
jgi:hypothetical protein